MKNKNRTRRIVAALLIVLGCILGVTWNRSGFCAGDALFTALHIPAWSNTSNGFHYPAVAGSLLILAGVGILNSTLQKKARAWFWTGVILLLLVLSLVFTRV